MDLKTDEGIIISQKNEKVAVYQDKTGKVTALSAVCTHSGCSVIWNGNDKTWDCPCHGSRFNTDGKIMKGPATKDLPKKELDK
jgi:Rieske Fe-S protein